VGPCIFCAEHGLFDREAVDAMMCLPVWTTLGLLADIDASGSAQR
jgi:hypothetical protein